MANRRGRSRNKPKKDKKISWSFIAKFAIILCILFLATIFSILNMGSTKIINNVYINDISVSALSNDEARTKLQDTFNEQLSKEIKVKFEDYEAVILPAEINYSYDISSALEEAYSVGRTGNIITNNLNILLSMFKKKNIDAPVSYDTEKLDNIIENISVEIPGLVVEPTYYTSDDELIITKGTSGNSLNKDKCKELIISAIKNGQGSIDLPVSVKEPDAVDITKIHDEIYSEPQNASVTKEPYSVTVEKKGVDFGISIEEAQNLVNNSENQQITIPLVYKDAEITVADLGEDIFGTTLSRHSTKYDSTNVNRATNLEIAASKINGIVLAPGEVFSFNKVVGERTAKNGFKEAIIYSDGELDYGIGGGICQISSNLYYSVLLANLEIVERKNHSMTVNYLPIGCDATVSYGSVDFQFKNSRSYPIKIVATVNSGIVTISICGVKEEKEYDVDIVVDTIQKDDYETVYQKDTSIPAGTEVVKQSGKEGYKCSTYRVLSLNGNEVSKTLLSTDTYKPQERIILTNK